MTKFFHFQKYAFHNITHACGIWLIFYFRQSVPIFHVSLSIMYLLFLPYPVSDVFRGFLGIPLPAKTSGLTEAVMHTVAPY